MNTRYINIYIDVDACFFDGGDGHTSDDIANYESALQYALDRCLPDACYQTLVYINVKPRVIQSINITRISGLDFTEPDQQATSDIIKARLKDSDFITTALEIAWSQS